MSCNASEPNGNCLHLLCVECEYYQKQISKSNDASPQTEQDEAPNLSVLLCGMDGQQNSIIDVHTMAISSLPPIEFEELEKCLKMLAENRRIALPKW